MPRYRAELAQDAARGAEALHSLLRRQQNLVHILAHASFNIWRIA